MNFDELLEKNNLKLNSQQIEAVKSVEGPILLLAVPGSGKTTVLVTRLGYMIYCKKIDPRKILTLTYTVAATKDMALRYEKFFGNEFSGLLEFRTINGICSKIISYYCRKNNKTAFDIEDEKVILGLLSSIYTKVTGEFATESDIKGVRTFIAYIKNMLLNKEEIEELDKKVDMPISEIYELYKKEMIKRKKMDFDDQMVYARIMLKQDPELLRFFQSQYDYICVDEAQDTSKIQHIIISMLAENNKNIFMVGDEDQSIYGYRAAYPEALLLFEKNYDNAKVLLMEKNYRSNANIVKAADQFIQKNEFRHEKHMEPVREGQAEIKRIKVQYRSHQYSRIIKLAEEQVNDNKEVAVLYRDNESILPVIDVLERKNIPYRIKAADFAFFTNRIVVDICNILKFALNPYDDKLFMSIYYKVSTFLKKKEAELLCELSVNYKMTILDAAILYSGIEDYKITKLKALRTHLANMLSDTAEYAITRIIDYMGYGEYLERNNLNDDKIDIIRALANHEKSPQSFLYRLEELAELIRNKEADYNCNFILSTIHSSKGLEYDNVYIMDVADGLFPSNVIRDRKKAKESEIAEYEEERRLFYVGVTRARDNLYLFSFDKKSSFIDELLNDKVSGLTESMVDMPYGEASVKRSVTAKPKKKFDQKAYEEFKRQLKRRTYVEHIGFGECRVLSMDGDIISFIVGDLVKNFSVKFLYENDMIVLEDE